MVQLLHKLYSHLFRLHFLLFLHPCLLKNILNKKSENEIFDVVISSQVIEHVSDDNELLKEIGRLLKSDGIAYISTVIKKWYGFYIYRNGGKFRLDPTHVKEYPSK